MNRITWPALIALVALSGCAQPTPEQQIVNDAAGAMGGVDKIKSVKTLVIEGDGVNGNLGQDVTPEATSQTFKLTDYKRVIDVAGGRTRIEQTRTPNFTYFQGQQPQEQVMGIDSAVGYNVAPDGAATRVPNAVADDRRAEFYHHPLTIVRAALDPAAKLSNPHTMGNERVVDVTTAGGLKFTLAIDAGTKLPTRVVSMTDNTNLGDVAIQTSFTDYQDVSGLKLPARLTTMADKTMTAEIHATKQTIDGPTGDLAAPAAAASAGPLAGTLPAVVTVEPVSKGIWLLAGQTHHSVLVEFADHLTLIEAPQNDTRALAVIAKAREVLPPKPLTHVINTHHHFDHSGGIRAAVSQGLTVITQKMNTPFFANIVERSHTIVPDALAMNRKPLKIDTVDDELVLKDAAMTVNLYRVTDSPHSDTMLMAYFPKERILVEADLFSPGNPVQPFAASLLANIKKHEGLVPGRDSMKIDRIVPIHGKVVPFSDFLKIVEAKPAN